MAVIKTIEKGESLTFGFVFPETYNLANLQAVKIYIGSSIYEHKMDGRTVRVELESNQTALITGRNIVHFVIDDAVFGIKKINCGELEVLPTQATHKDESVNTGYDVEIVLSINVETVSVGSVLYNTLKGDKGDAGTIDVGTVTTGDAGTDVIVENVGTQSEAILNFTIPRGNSGDFFSGDYNLIINKQDCVWVDGWLWIDTGSKTAQNIIEVGYMAISTGNGTNYLKPIVHYPAGLTYEIESVPNGFYLRDEDGFLRENVDFEFLEIRYNVKLDTGNYKYDGLIKINGINAAFDDFDVSHSATMRTIFLQIYEGFTGEVYRAATDILCNNTRIDAHFEPTYARIRNLDIIGIPITNGASTEQSGSNPDILKISSHYNNTFARKDITANETTFLNNVIAVGSCSDMESPTAGTSFGYGVEFFEDTSRTAQEYPNFGSYGNSQSASTAIITAKFKIIKDTTGVSWSIVRKAARITARKTVGGVYAAGFPWDMYRGFGIIDVDAAIQYIKDNYTENDDYLNILADDVERTRGIDPMLPFEKISENTPIPKGKMHEVTENNYTDEDKAKLDAYPELTGIASDGFVNAAGEIQQIAAAVGGFANNLYFSNADSDVAGYKTLTYDLPVAETVISQAVSSGDGEVLVESHLYPDPISADIFPSGLWSFEFYGRVSSTVGTTQIGVRYFRYTSANEKVYLFPAIVWSNAINNTVNNWIPILVQQPSFSVQTGDRMGCDIFVKSTSMVARTVYYILGDGYASYLNNPNAVRHRTLRAKNEELAYQHLDATTEKATPIDTDSVGLWNSLAGKFVRTTWANIKATLKTYFDTLYASLAGATFTGEISALFGVKAAKIYPNADSTTAVQVTKADKTTAVLNIDTTNSMVAINAASAEDSLHVKTPNQGYLLFGGSNGRTLRARNADGSAGNFDLTGGVYISGGIEGGSTFQLRFGAFPVMLRQDGGASYLSGGTFGVGVTAPKSRIHADGAIQVANDTSAASSDKVGAIRYRADANNSYMEMCMQTGASTYAWVVIKQNTW